LFQEADGGTIFLDEIGSMSATLQSRLLRVLQEKEVRRVGDNVPTYVNVRVLAATHEPLEEKIKQGLFREDLYYRLNVISMNLPALRERPEDIPLLVSHFLKNRVHAGTGKRFSMTKKVMDVLCGYHWPGNVRELENAIERACVLCDDATIRVKDLPPSLRNLPSARGKENDKALFELAFTEPAALALSANEQNLSAAQIAPTFGMPPLKDFLREQEMVYVNRVLDLTDGDKEKAADMLGISVTTMYRKLSDDETPH
jgi:DNA-binding NtrC family response regulator